MKTIAELVKLFVSNKNKIDELKRENQHAVYEYVSQYVSDGEVAKIGITHLDLNKIEKLTK